ncbi:MAG: hypothetical protein PW845_29960 [Pseudomonas sp.]|nr:hypothetical protein [Pseudomonas sp.]
MKRLPVVPASFFAMTLGLAETGNAWRLAVPLWHLPPAIGEWLEGLAILSFAWWFALYLNKWLNHRQVALTEARDPVQASFLALIPESLMLVAAAVLPWQGELARGVFWIGSAGNLAYGAYRLSAMWTQPREAAQNVPPLFLSYTASVLVNALVAGLFGYVDYGWMLFGVGAISWLVLDSTVSGQLMVGGLAVKTRNFMGIYMAPSVVALVAYQVLAGDQANSAFTHALAGYALFVAIAMVLAWRWLREQPFAAGYWAYTFGLATLAQGLLTMAQRGHDPLIEGLALVALAASLLLTGAVALGTLRLFQRNAYYPIPSPA